MAEFIPFRFRVSLFSPDGGQDQLICRGAFSEVSGLEASMSAKTLKEGGRNWGEVQLAGPTSFPPIVLKRGVTEIDDLHNWFDVTTRMANYAQRMSGLIEVFDRDGAKQPILSWSLRNALATKFKGPDLSSSASQVAIEELHLVHEGLSLTRRKPQAAKQGAAGA